MVAESEFENGYITSERWKLLGRKPDALRKRYERGTAELVIPGVFRDANAPPHPHEETYAAYLKIRDRLTDSGERLAVAGAAAAALWDHGDLHDGPIDVFTTRTSTRIQLSGRVSLWHRPGWFGRPMRIVARHDIPVLMPHWLAVDLLQRGIGDRGHIRAFLDSAAATGNVTAGDFVAPIADLLDSRHAIAGGVTTLASHRPALMVQLGKWNPSATDNGPLVRRGSGTDLETPPAPKSDAMESLRLAAAGYWHLDPNRATNLQHVIAARQGRTLAVFDVTNGPHHVGGRFWFELRETTDPVIIDEFVGDDGRTFRSTRNPIRYWPEGGGASGKMSR